MNEILTLFLVAIAGLFLGVLFFGGLWLTVSRGMQAKAPAVVFLLSFVLRMGITVAGFYLVCGDQWQRFLACLGGFLVARFVVSKITESLNSKEQNPGKEVEV